jgi:hypothetical protein
MCLFDTWKNLYVDAPLKGCVISNTQRSIEPLTSTSSRANDINNLQSTTILSPATIRTLPHSTSNSSVNFSKCRKDTCNLSNKQLHSVTGVHRTKTPASTNSSLHNHHHHHHHHSNTKLPNFVFEGVFKFSLLWKNYHFSM